MKKSHLLFFFILFSIIVFGQNNSETRLLIEAYETAKLGSKFNDKYSKVVGEPYFQNRFASAKIKNVPITLAVRYNAYDDEFEFIDSKNDTLVLSKSEELGTITFVNSSIQYHFLDYTNDKNKVVSGYLIYLYEKDNMVLYKKQNIAFFSEKVSPNPLQASVPAQFIPTKDVFYFKNGDNGISEFPSNKKGLLKLFPERKDQIEDFLKKNDIDFADVTDKKKILDFLAK